jgi:hypothetical protein
LSGLAERGRPAADVLADLDAMRSGDARWRDGRAFSLVYYATPELLEIARDAYALYMAENGLNTTAFPSLARMQAEVVEMVVGLTRGTTAAGFMTSGGTESILMAVLAARYPQDVEASIFYALALAQSAPPTDKSYADLLKAGAILEPLFAKYPDHPGLAHYIIHSYDVPALAAHALAAARRYAEIAPSAPHALHMPSHTFTRVGYWQESIDANIASAATAKRDGATAEELHATDYQTYAYLQTGQDRAARRLLDSLPEIAARFDPDAAASAAPGVAGVFALAAIPARWALERGEWAEAAKLEPHASRFPQTEAMTHLARGLGAARSGDAAAARAAALALEQIRGRLEAAHESYWAGQVEIQRRIVVAWLAIASHATTMRLWIST